jgi:hypothetical protein
MRVKLGQAGEGEFTRWRVPQISTTLREWVEKVR